VAFVVGAPGVKQMQQLAALRMLFDWLILPTRSPPFEARNDHFRPEHMVGLMQMLDPYQCTASANHGSVALVIWT
jgi:hypothetical protein